MILLFFFSWIAGLATALSPCILPILPIILASSVTRSKWYPIGVIAGLILTFSLATLFLAQLIQSLGISDQVLRTISAVVLLLMAIAMLLPQAEELWNKFAAKIPQPKNTASKSGLLGGLFVGSTLGLVWAPCAGPILASVTTLVATQGISFQLAVMLIAFGLGVAIPLAAIAYGGAYVFQTLPVLKRSSGTIRKGFGALTAVTAIILFLNLQTAVAAKITDFLPTNFAAPLERLENSALAAESLKTLNNAEQEKSSQDNNDMKPVNYAALPIIKKAPEFSGLSDWINSAPLTLADLRGKVVLVDFWTYSCVNCLRTLPYLSMWNEKYHDKGLVIIGVHAPEFAFEHDSKNVADAVTRQNIKYPVALDNSFGTWRAFQNQYWPAHYFIDKEGNIRHQHFGEGEYEESEKVIQELLLEGTTTKAEAVKASSDKPLAVDYGMSLVGETPETYLGSSRRSRLEITTTIPELHHVALSEGWLANKEFIESTSNKDELLFHVQAQKVFLVAEADSESKILVQTIDSDRNVLSERSEDIKNAKLYTMQDNGTQKDVIVRLIPQAPGIRLFAFTFGA